MALEEHIKSLGPTKKQKEETRELMEVLLMLGEEPLARSVQKSLKTLESRHLEAMEKLKVLNAGQEDQLPAKVTSKPEVTSLHSDVTFKT